jgi:hypothetical protein
MRSIAFGLLLCTGVFSGTAWSYDPLDPKNCNGVAWNNGHAMVVAKVTARPRVNFVKSPYDDDFKAVGCPAATEACRKTSYLVTDDPVLAGERRDEFTCISYQSPQAKKSQSGRAAGCRARRLRLSRQCRGRRHRIGSARGARTAGSRSGTPVAESCALKGYVSSRCPAATPTTAPSRLAKPFADMLAFEDEKSYGQCRVRIQRIGARLLVEDNGAAAAPASASLGSTAGRGSPPAPSTKSRSSADSGAVLPRSPLAVGSTRTCVAQGIDDPT